MKTCKLEYCFKEVYAKELCSKHYANFRKHGTYEAPQRGKKIDFEIDNNNCFNCTSHPINKDGYPVVGRFSKNWLMNRFIYTEMFGEIPENLVVRHKCDNSKCINPEHLILGTVQDNNHDMILRDRYVKGSEMYNASLTEDDVFAINVLIGKQKLTNRKIAEIFSVHERVISDIKTGRKWKHVKFQFRNCQ